MKFAVLGTGMVGKAISDRLAELGHEVAVGTRSPDATRARADWAPSQPSIELATFADAAAAGEIVVNATGGGISLDVLGLAGAANLAGKILIDIANPLDFSHGMPPTLSVVNTDSVGEQIQRAFPETRVVKTLNTMNASLMVHPDQLDDPGTVFVSGNDDQAKQVVTDLLHAFGHRDVIDLGDITTARGSEMLLPIWIRLMGKLGSPKFQFKIVR